MIYGISHSRTNYTPWAGYGNRQNPVLGKRSRRHQLRLRDAWRQTWHLWSGPPFEAEDHHWPHSLRVIRLPKFPAVGR